MAHTNSTTHYGLPQWIGSDKPTFLGDFNSAFNTIDTQMKSNADTASGAAETATSANATAISANETAVTADAKATLAKNTADAATSAAQSASDLAIVAKNTADNAARTAQGNNIANLAPAYDETRTYSVGDLVTYVDENNSGKLYKCIVAWNTPGAFNINYWDDVTASEVFNRAKRTLVAITTDGIKTTSEILSEIAVAIQGEDLTFAKFLILTPGTPAGHQIFDCTDFMGAECTFARNREYANYIRFNTLQLNAGIPANNFYRQSQLTKSNDEWTHTDKSAEVAAAGSEIWTVIVI